MPEIVTRSKLILLTARQANECERRGAETRNTTVFRKEADQEDGRLMFQNNPLWGLDARLFYRTEK